MQTLHATFAKDATFLITEGHLVGFTAINLQILGDLGVSSPRNFDYFFQPSANRRPSTAQSDKYRLMRFW